MRIDPDRCNWCLECHNKCKRHGTTLVHAHDVLFIIINTNCNRCGECISICKQEAIYEI